MADSTSSNKSTHSTRGSTSSPLRSGFRPAASMAELMAKASLQVLQKGQSVSGTIKKLTPQEILMDIGAKGDALVIEFDKQNLENLLANLKVGDRVTATVISPESEEGFPVVSLRRTLDDIIFKKFEDLALGDEAFEVEIAEATRGGYFALTPEGVRGFLPSSQVLGNTLNSGAKIKVKILEYDRSKKRVVFSQKATAYVTNVDSIKSLVKPGELIEAQISEVVPYGLFAKIEVGVPALNERKRVEGSRPELVEGFVHISEVSHERVENLGALYKAGDKIKAEVLDIDSANRRVNLSIKKTKLDVFASVRERYKAEDKVSGTVSDVRPRGVTLSLEEGVNGFIPSDKISSETTYEVGQSVSCEVVDFDDRRRRLILSPILKAVPIGYR
ncbi:MAG: S1 RNA-binding domain-containing protein [Candidatus Levybacteria bacterium]|nr:S1 RNA-binding domain-containing protein [Candidatus Levybacteria bacterium]